MTDKSQTDNGSSTLGDVELQLLASKVVEILEPGLSRGLPDNDLLLLAAAQAFLRDGDTAEWLGALADFGPISRL